MFLEQFRNSGIYEGTHCMKSEKKKKMREHQKLCWHTIVFGRQQTEYSEYIRFSENIRRILGLFGFTIFGYMKPCGIYVPRAQKFIE